MCDVTQTRNRNEYFEKKNAKKMKGFVRYQDLKGVGEARDETDKEVFRSIPSFGIGVIGVYRKLRDMEDSAPSIIVRESVYKKLRAADKALKAKPEYSNCQIVVTYGYRSPEIQKALWNEIIAEVNSQNPTLSDEERYEIAHTKIAHPDVAGHPTGGAVDVTIYDFNKNAFLPFGTEVGDLSSTAAYYNADGIADDAKKNRQVLHSIMKQQGFAPYLGEWWHFSYGDKEWAFYYKRPIPLYHQKQHDDISGFYHGDKYSNILINDGEIRIRLAVQKEGRLTDHALSILSKSGIDLTKDRRSFLARSNGFPLDVLFVRDDDIPSLVESGSADVGIVGENVYWEKQKNIKGNLINGIMEQSIIPNKKGFCTIERELGFGKCFLGLAVPRSSKTIRSLKDLQGKKIATSYRNLTEQFLDVHGLKGKVTIIDISGSVEIAPLVDYADAIVDIVSTGSSLKQNNLELLNDIHILDSEAILISNNASKSVPAKSVIIDSLLERIDSYLLAKKFKRVVMNVPTAKIDIITNILMNKARQVEDESSNNRISINTPIVLPSYEKNNEWSSIQIVMKLSDLWSITSDLKSNNVCNIIFYDIEGIVNGA